jgi:hypothetical protein
MAIQRPVVWVTGLINRFEEQVSSSPFSLITPLSNRVRSIFEMQCLLGVQLPFRNGPASSHSRINVEQNKQCLIEISKHKFSLVISGLTRILQRITEVGVSSVQIFKRFVRGQVFKIFKYV